MAEVFGVCVGGASGESYYLPSYLNELWRGVMTRRWPDRLFESCGEVCLTVKKKVDVDCGFYHDVTLEGRRKGESRVVPLLEWRGKDRLLAEHWAGSEKRYNVRSSKGSFFYVPLQDDTQEQDNGGNGRDLIMVMEVFFLNTVYSSLLGYRPTIFYSGPFLDEYYRVGLFGERRPEEMWVVGSRSSFTLRLAKPLQVFRSTRGLRRRRGEITTRWRRGW